MKNIFLVCILISASLFSSCKDETDIVKASSKKNRTTILSGGGNYTLEEVIDDLNTGNLVGMVELYKQLRSDVVVTKNGGTRTGINYDGYEINSHAGFFTPIYDAINVRGLVVNAEAYTQYAPGAYQVARPNELEVNFGGVDNKFQIENNESFNAISDAVTFSSPISITGLSRGDNISKSNPFTLQWTGGGSGKVEVKIRKTDMFGDVLTSVKNTGVRFFMDNNGTYTFSSNLLNSVLELNGQYDVTVTNFEPRYKTVSSGKQILFLGISSHNITVNVTN